MFLGNAELETASKELAVNVHGSGAQVESYF
jgi:hypothetical protein